MRHFKHLAITTSILFTAMAVEAQPSSAAADKPVEPIVAAIPEITENTGAGPAFDSSTAQWPGYDIEHYNYEINEYVITGTAAGAPYKTRLVIRQPADDTKFSGLVVAEAMHPAGQAHAFQHNSVYVMDAGHITVEVTTLGLDPIKAFNPARYGDFSVTPAQVNEILAQAGALIKSEQSPIAELGLRKMVLWGSSASSRILVDYLPAHKVFKTAQMENIYDGFMPTSNGTTIPPVDVPMIQLPTQHEYMNVATAQQDSDEPGKQFRSYEFVGMGHLMARNNHDLTPDQCTRPITTFPLEPYFSLGLHYLLEWVDKGTSPPHADRVLLDRNIVNDGSLMILDEHGNPEGGIRNPYVDVPFTQYIAGNENTPASTAGILCRLSMWEAPFTKEKMRELYGTKENYVRMFEADLDALETAGWSLPVYHDLIVGDARAVEF
ncbi:MAG: alpha/beta hydrolase domain-containing protein [Pseudomonadota bacterium]